MESDVDEVSIHENIFIFQCGELHQNIFKFTKGLLLTIAYFKQYILIFRHIKNYDVFLNKVAYSPWAGRGHKVPPPPKT